MNENATTWIVYAVDVLEPVILALIGLGAAYLSTWLRAKTANEQVDGITRRLVAAAEVAVRDTEQTLVRALKAGAADGKLSREDARAASAAALETLTDLAGPKGIATANAVLGDSETWLVSLIEAEVDRQKGSK